MAKLPFYPLVSSAQVLKTRIDGSVVVIECDFNINLAALTLEEVLGKRRKVVKDMCDQLAVKERHDAQGESWRALRTAGEDAAKPVPRAVEAFIEKRLMPLATKDPSFYNENAPLGQAIGEAVAVADIAAGWTEGRQALASVAAVGADVETAREAQKDEAGAVTVEQLVRWKGPLAVSLRIERYAAVPIGMMHGLCALMWVMHVKKAPLSLDVSKRKIRADGLAALARGMAPSLTTLLLDDSVCTNLGGNLSGVKLLCSVLESGFADGLKELRCAPTRFQTVMIAHVGKCLVMPYSPALCLLCSLANNKLHVEGCKAVAAVLDKTQITSLKCATAH